MEPSGGGEIRSPLSTSTPKIIRRRPLSTTIDDGAVHSPPRATDGDKKARQQKRRSDSYDHKKAELHSKDSQDAGSTISLLKTSRDNKAERKERLNASRKSGGYTKKGFQFENNMETLLENCSFDFNSTDAVLMVRSPSVPRRGAPHNEAKLSGSFVDKTSTGSSISSKASSDDESGSLSPTKGISFDLHDPDVQGEIYSPGRRKSSREASPKGKERPERDDAEQHSGAGADDGEVVALVADDVAVVESRGLLFNFRDLCQATHHGVVPGLVFRSAALTRADVHPLDLHRVLVFLRKGLNIKTIIDLRAKDEKVGDKLDWIVEKVYPTIKDPTVSGADHVKRFNISFLNRDVKLKGLFWPCPRSTKLKMVLNIFNKEEMTKVFARDVMNALGLAGLNKLMIIYSHAEIVRALRVVADIRNHPVMIHCASGKDRTGLICALVLACCGVSEEEIVQNYQESEKYLTPVMDRIQEENALKGLDSSFDGTPREVMQETLAFINDKWGSIAEYLDEIGFTFEDQRQLASVLVPRQTKRVRPTGGLKKSSGRIGIQRREAKPDEGQQTTTTTTSSNSSNNDDAQRPGLLTSPEVRKRSLSGTMGPLGLVSAEFYSILSQGCEDMLVKQVSQDASVL